MTLIKTTTDGRKVEVKGDTLYVDGTKLGSQIWPLVAKEKEAMFARYGKNPYTHRVGNVVFTADEAEMAKNEISEFYKKQDENKRNNLEAKIPGLGEIIDLSKHVSEDLSRYFEEKEKMFASESPRMLKSYDVKANERLESLLAKNPRAKTYLDAQKMANTTNMSTEGRKAMDVLLSGGSIDDAKREMDRSKAWD